MSSWNAVEEMYKEVVSPEVLGGLLEQLPPLKLTATQDEDAQGWFTGTKKADKQVHPTISQFVGRLEAEQHNKRKTAPELTKLPNFK